MTEQEIQELARHRKVPSWVIKLVADAVVAEREACAKVCEEQTQGKSEWKEGAIACAAAIRARG